MEINKVSQNFFQMNYTEIKTLQTSDISAVDEISTAEISQDEEICLTEQSNIENTIQIKEDKKISNSSDSNSERVTFKIFADRECVCSNIKSIAQTVNEQLSDETNIEFISYDQMHAIIWGELEVNEDDNYIDYPCIIKYVDGKPVELYDGSTIAKNTSWNTNTSTESRTDNLIDFLKEKIAEPLSEKEENEDEGKIEYIINSDVFDINELQSILGDDVTITTLKDKAKESGKERDRLMTQYVYDATGKCPTLVKNKGDDFSHISRPSAMLIKLVDGKAVAAYTSKELGYSQYYQVKADNISKLTNFIQDDYTQTKLDIEEQKNVQICNSETTSNIQNTTEKTAEDISKGSMQTEFTQDISTDTIKNIIENATSISDLKIIVTNNSFGLDFSTQMKLRNTVSSLSFDSNLNKAKSTLLELLR